MKPFWIYLNENTPDHDTKVMVLLKNGSMGYAHYDAEEGFTPANCYAIYLTQIVFDDVVVAYAIVEDD